MSAEGAATAGAAGEARRIVDRLGLRPHPEGGFYREVHRAEAEVIAAGDDAPGAGRRRAAVTHIYFLLAAGDLSALHRVRGGDEIWNLLAGGPLELHLIDGAGRHRPLLLTRELERGEPTATVPAGCWQAARVAAGAGWALAGCTVAPGFDFADFEMPPRAELAARFPQHRELVRELTRDG